MEGHWLLCSVVRAHFSFIQFVPLHWYISYLLFLYLKVFYSFFAFLIFVFITSRYISTYIFSSRYLETILYDRKFFFLFFILSFVNIFAINIAIIDTYPFIQCFFAVNQRFLRDYKLFGSTNRLSTQFLSIFLFFFT